MIMSSLQQLSHHQHLLRWVAHHQRHLLGIGIGFIISFSGGIVFVVVLVILIIAFIGGGTIDSGVGCRLPSPRRRRRPLLPANPHHRS